jgi:hypothetical protein
MLGDSFELLFNEAHVLQIGVPTAPLVLIDGDDQDLRFFGCRRQDPVRPHQPGRARRPLAGLEKLVPGVAGGKAAR